LNESNKPIKTVEDGTKDILNLAKFIDTIGIQWTFDCLLKLCAIFIIDGFPNDIILFTNDRYMQALDCLTLALITQPLIVLMDCKYLYKLENKGKLEYNDVGFKHLNSDIIEDLYDFEAYKLLSESQKAYPITHHECVDKLKFRIKNKLNPFNTLLKELKTNFYIDKTDKDIFKTEFPNDSLNINELLLRYVYIYIKKYKSDKLAYMHKARLSEF